MTRWPVFFFLWMATGLHAADPGGLYLQLSGRGEKTRLGLTDIAVDRGAAEEAPAAVEIKTTLARDLDFTGSFTLLNDGPNGDGRRVKTDGWVRLGADVVATGRLGGGSAGRRVLDGALLDARTGRALLSKSFAVDEGPRRAAHRWADEIVRYFTGQAGVASSRVVFVNDAGGAKEVCVVDYDGGNFRRLTADARSIALFPKFSPDGAWIVFTSFREGGPTVHLMRANGAERRVLCRFEGLNSATAWMPDGQSLIATLSMGREPNLYRVGLDGRVVQVMTNSSADDTAPTVSPDGLRLAFTSDRAGLPQIYAMDTTGANLQRLTTTGQCDSPQWSPLGHLLVFTMSVKGNFDLYTLEIATGRQTRLTFGEGDNENASWSPDGRYLVFTSTRRGRPELWVMNADGTNPRVLGNIPGRSFTPHWGR